QEREFAADGVICTIPAPSITRLVSELDGEQQAFFDAVKYSSSVAVAVALRESLKSTLYGFFSARRETEYLAAVTIESGKLQRPHPTGHDVIGLFSSGIASPELINYPDQTIYDFLWTDLSRTGFPLPFTPAPLTYHVRRWPLALPMFDV